MPCDVLFPLFQHQHVTYNHLFHLFYQPNQPTPATAHTLRYAQCLAYAVYGWPTLAQQMVKQ